MKIILFMPNYIGDVLMTTPAIRFLKKSVSSLETYVVIKQNLVELVNSNTYVDNIVVKLSRSQILNDIIKIKPDYAILFRTTFFNSLITKIVSVKYSVGTNEEFSNIFLTETIRKDVSRPYRAECATLVEKFLKHLSIERKISVDELKKIDFFGWDNQEIKTSVEQKLNKFSVDTTKKLVVISPFSTRKTKMLTTEQYVELVSLLNKKYNKDIEIVFVGDKNSVLFVNQIINKSESGICKSLCGELNLKELGYLLSISSYLISVDSGPAFIAQAVNTKTIIIFTSTLSEKYGPYNDNVKIVYNPVLCSPCYKNECKTKDYKCINQVKLEEVINNILL